MGGREGKGREGKRREEREEKGREGKGRFNFTGNNIGSSSQIRIRHARIQAYK